MSALMVSQFNRGGAREVRGRSLVDTSRAVSPLFIGPESLFKGDVRCLPSL